MLSSTEQPELESTCVDDELEDDKDHEKDHYDSVSRKKSLFDSMPSYNNTNSDKNDDDGQCAVSQNTEFTSAMTNGRARDPRRKPLGVISEVVSIDYVSVDVDSDICSDMAQLKATTARLKLATRRPSYVAWQAQVQQRPKNPPKATNIDNDILTEERKNWITNALQWITEELTDMRHQDQDLARQLLSIRQEIQRLKLNISCEFHQDMLADVQLEMEELGELSEICDQLPPIINDNPLRHLGVTRMNISARRFSTC